MKSGWFAALLVVFLLRTGMSQQQSPVNASPQSSPQISEPTSPITSDDSSGETQAPPRSPNESSSRDTIINLSPPRESNDSSPYSKDEDVQELHPWDPHRAAKDIEVADFYFKRWNYRGALDRYREALYYKPNDALATFGMARCDEKLGKYDEARTSYEAYLKILPNGPKADEARKEIARLAKINPHEKAPESKNP